MASMKTWERWTQKTKEFPKSKYGFTEYLRRVGDYVETHPMSRADYIRIKDAAKFWAYHHKVRVKIRVQKTGDGMYTVMIMLVSKTREREDEY